MADTSSKPAAKKNPLDILEDILDNAEVNKEEEAAEKEAAKVAAEIKVKEDEAHQRDMALLEQERAKMTDIEQSPEAQARVSQIQEKSSQQQQEASDSEGFEIRQLGHKKI
jgi:hypothetical protein